MPRRRRGGGSPAWTARHAAGACPQPPHPHCDANCPIATGLTAAGARSWHTSLRHTCTIHTYGRMYSSYVPAGVTGRSPPVDDHQMFELAQELAAAKSRQDVPAAMRLFHRDIVLQFPAFALTARG